MIEVSEIVQVVNITIVEENESVSINVTDQLTTVNLEVAEVGMQGFSAYDIAVQNGFVGTEVEWSNSFKTIKLINLPLLP